MQFGVDFIFTQRILRAKAAGFMQRGETEKSPARRGRMDRE